MQPLNLAKTVDHQFGFSEAVSKVQKQVESRLIAPLANIVAQYTIDSESFLGLSIGEISRLYNEIVEKSPYQNLKVTVLFKEIEFTFERRIKESVMHHQGRDNPSISDTALLSLPPTTKTLSTLEMDHDEFTKVESSLKENGVEVDRIYEGPNGLYCELRDSCLSEDTYDDEL